MTYNFIEKIRKGEFSLEEDYKQTLQDLVHLFDKTPIGQATNRLEAVLGHLQPRDEVAINSAYTFAILLASAGILSYFGDDKLGSGFYLTMSTFPTGLGLLHHSAIGKKMKKKIN